jgi:hypothetical protein
VKYHNGLYKVLPKGVLGKPYGKMTPAQKELFGITRKVLIASTGQTFGTKLSRLDA